MKLRLRGFLNIKTNQHLSVASALLLLCISLSFSSCNRSVSYSWEMQQKINGYGLFGISMTDMDNGWAIGEANLNDFTIFSFNGSSWSSQKSMEVWLHAISSVDRNHAWVVGANADNGRGVVYFFDGSDWESQFEVEEDLTTVFSLDAKNVWAGGTHGGIYYFDGTSWQARFRIEKSVKDIFATSEKDVWILGGQVYHYDGTALEADREFLESYDSEEGLLSPNCVAGAQDNVWVTVTDNLGKSAIYLRNSNSWEKQYEGALILQDIKALNANYAWAIGVSFEDDLSGTCYCLLYDGTEWTTEYEEPGVMISEISFFNKDQVWASGITNGAIYLGVRNTR